MLCQLVDFFGLFTLRLILGIGYGFPLGSILVTVIIVPRRSTSLPVVILIPYYLAVALTLASANNGAISTFFTFALSGIGYIIAVYVFLIGLHKSRWR